MGRVAAWEAAKSRLPKGSRVNGVIIARYRFGVFVDIEVEFPALLQIVCMEGLTSERYQADDWCPVSRFCVRVRRWVRRRQQADRIVAGPHQVGTDPTIRYSPPDSEDD
jgi:hypothetical protein